MTRAGSPLSNRVIFLTGARRSGTYWLQRIVTAHPRVGAVPSETHLFSHGIRPLIDRLEGSDPGDATVGRVWVDRDRLIDAVRGLCDVVFEPYRGNDGGWVSERTPLHVYHLGLIAEVYPDAKLVQIVRDGRDVVRSLLEQNWGPTTHEAAALEWRDAIRAAQAAGLPASVYREIRYEDLLADPGPQVAELFEWLGVTAAEAELEAALAAAGEVANTAAAEPGAERWRSALSKRQIAKIELVCGEELALMGYTLASR